MTLNDKYTIRLGGVMVGDNKAIRADKSYFSIHLKHFSPDLLSYKVFLFSFKFQDNELCTIYNMGVCN